MSPLPWERTEAYCSQTGLWAGADTWATSTALGLALRRLGEFDLILAGRQAIDGDTAQIGPQVAEFLGIPQLTYVSRLEVQQGKVIAEENAGRTAASA